MKRVPFLIEDAPCFSSREISPELFPESASWTHSTLAALPPENLWALQEPAEAWKPGQGLDQKSCSWVICNIIRCPQGLVFSFTPRSTDIYAGAYLDGNLERKHTALIWILGPCCSPGIISIYDIYPYLATTTNRLLYLNCIRRKRRKSLEGDWGGEGRGRREREDWS